MEKKILLTDLDSYKNAEESLKVHPLIKKGRGFDLSKIKNDEFAKEMESMILKRGEKLSPLSLRTEIYPFNQFCEFMNQRFPDLDTLKEANIEELVRKARVWLTLNGKNTTQKRSRIYKEETETIDAELIRYIRKIYKYFNKEDIFNYDSDVWVLDGIPIDLRINPTKTVNTISFKKIKQEDIRSEIKKTIYHLLSISALGTIQAEITAINHFSDFLNKKYPDVDTLNDVSRELLESYFTYIHTEATGRKSYVKQLHHLKTVLSTAGKILDNQELEHLFYEDDIGTEPAVIYKVYSDAEIKRLNAAIVESEPQIARALIIHQLIGTRISETLTLKRNALSKTENGRLMLTIEQIKTGKSYKKAIGEDVKRLFDKACDWTAEKYGDTEYVFVCDKQPSMPMQYSRLQYQLMCLIAKNNLVDDKGEKFGVGTHIWRHTYGKRLTELHVDDVTIAKLLGHSNTSTLNKYRKVGNKMLSEETSEMRTGMSDVLDEITAEWF